MKYSRNIQNSQFELEPLEPRIMLSGEGAAACSDATPQIVQQMFDDQDVAKCEKSDLSLQVAIPSMASLFEADEEDVEASNSETVAEESVTASANSEASKERSLSGAIRSRNWWTV